jgi:hypothetical protein
MYLLCSRFNITCAEDYPEKELSTQMINKLDRVCETIPKMFPEIEYVSVPSVTKYPNSKGDLVGTRINFEIECKDPEIDKLFRDKYIEICFPSSKPPLEDIILRAFRIEYNGYKSAFGL